MISLWPLGVYCLIALFAARFAYNYMRADMMSIDPDWDLGESIGIGYCALLLGFFWPLLIPIAVVTWKPRKTETERKVEKRERDEYIRKLERELGIRDR